MASPLQKRNQRIAALKQQEQLTTQNENDRGDVIIPNAQAPKSEWDIVRASIQKDVSALKSIKQIEDKLAYKARCLPQYESYISQANIPLDIAVMLMVWLFDCKDLERAISLGLYCATHGATMPAGFKPHVETFMADATLAWADAQWKAGHSVSPYFGQIFNLVTTEWDLYDQIIAKYYKLSGLMVLGPNGSNIKHQSEPALLYSAKALFQKAMKKYDKVGVGTRIDEIDKRLIKLQLPLTPEE
ncbi:phage terminase small subunit [Aliivibrio fischeri]|uniref:Terminase n=1 Tax=Aliivibrio fischeri TaxID=668 RepID=A0A510UFA7_ALIFS|nr:phage terminase small subunit [Aliivibrio fischeri]GEK13229.1 terminase [Aliivibrio fischeri]